MWGCGYWFLSYKLFHFGFFIGCVRSICLFSVGMFCFNELCAGIMTFAIIARCLSFGSGIRKWTYVPMAVSYHVR